MLKEASPRRAPVAFLDSLLPVVLLLLIYTASRLVLLTRLPIFLDEALNIIRARDAIPSDVFIGFRHNKWLYPVMLGLLRPYGPESLWLARSINAISGVLTCAGCIALGRLFDSRRAGLLAGAAYLVLPFSVFHMRQALVDPLMSTFAMLTLVFAVWLVRRPSPFAATLTGVALGISYLTKALALPFFAIPLAAVALLMRRGRARWRAGLFALLSTGLGYGMVRVVFVLARAAGRAPHSKVSVNAGKLSDYLGLTLSELLAKLVVEFAQYWEVLWVYFGPALIALALLSLYLILINEKRRALMFLWLPAVAFAVPPIIAKKPQVFLAPRYLTHTSAPFVVLAALTGEGLLRVLSGALPRDARGRSRWEAVARGLLLLALVVLPLPQDVGIIFHPESARIHSRDRWQYVTSLVAGTGRSDTSAFLVGAWIEAGQQQMAVVAASSTAQIQAEVGPRAAIFREWPTFQDNPDELAAWLAFDRPVFFVDEVPDNPLPDRPYGATLEQVAAFPLVNGTSRVFQVVGADDELRRAIQGYRFIGPDDARVADVYPDLAAALAADPTPRAVVAYPPNQLDTLRALLAGAPQVSVYAVGDQWPFDPDATAREFAGIASDHDYVEVVFLQETLGDPERTIEGWLTRHLFWEGQVWYEPLRVVAFAGVPGEVALVPVGATFGETITLEEAAIVDEETSVGEGVRVALVWDAAQPVTGAYKVFAHLVDADGALVAQHDGTPQGGLSPTESWGPARPPIPDRFVIALPGDLPSGDYDLRVGLYDPDTGVRLPLTSGAAGGPDFVLLGQVAVR